MNKILMTGATGFIGKEVCKVLGNRGIPFIAGVRQRTSNDQFEVGNLSGATDWKGALKGCDAVIHLAARVHVMKDKATDASDLYREVNVGATVNLARQAADSGTKRFIFVSSIKVNGESTTDIPFASGDRPAPTDPYGYSKLEAEQKLRELSRQTGMELVIVRPPLVYGPGVRANFLRLMQAVKLGLPLPFKNIQNRRSLVALDNIVDLLIRCASHPAASGHIFLVSDDYDLSTPYLVTLIAKSMNKQPFLLPMPAQFVSSCAKALGKQAVFNRMVGSLQVDITHTKKILGWTPLVSPDVAIQKTVSHFLQRHRQFVYETRL
jgi:nucleoside-diphosphate-sugar epimerase